MGRVGSSLTGLGGCRVTNAAPEPPRALPPGQKLASEFKVHHYGPVPRFRPDSWRLTINGATDDGEERHLDYAAFQALPRTVSAATCTA